MYIRCIGRPNGIITELTVGAKYDLLNLLEDKLMILNNLSKVEWYDMEYFELVIEK